MTTMETAPLFEKPTEDYLRIMTASPDVSIADTPANVATILKTYEDAKEEQAELLVLPELGITAYSAADLFHNDHVLEQAERGICELAKATADGPAMTIGVPLLHNDILYNCTAMLANGKIMGVVPKSHIPNQKEFYEKRWFTSGKHVKQETMRINGQEVPFGIDLLFDINDTTVGIEICEDAWAVIPPSAYAALAGAQIIINPSASNEIVGKDDIRRSLVSGLAGRLICGYVYTSAGNGESAADVVYGGHQLMGEAGRIVAEREPHDKEVDKLVYDFDRKYLQHDRVVNKTYADQAVDIRRDHIYRRIPLNVQRPTDDRLLRKVNPLPFVPSNPEKRNERCEKIITNLATALATGLKEHGTKGIDIGLSGGLDSTLGLIVSIEAAKLLGEDNDYIHTITMPGPASSNRTQDNATLLAEALGTKHSVMPIEDLTKLMLQTLGHDGVTEDVTFENVQARMRTNILLNYANMIGGMTQGTGDLSEILQGWCTFNGDHMSMYNPNCGVPKTLIRYLVEGDADFRADEPTKKILLDIIDTPISPELTGNGDLSQETESLIGPYELHDFTAYNHLRYGTTPNKIGYLATNAFAEDRTPEEIRTWLQSFYRRHTSSQGKRESAPNGPKIGSVSGSQRGDLRMAPNTSPHWHEG